MYNQIEKLNILQHLVTVISTNEKVEALMLVGSSARGDADRFSDLDFTIVAQKEDLEGIREELSIYITENYEVFKQFRNKYSDESLLLGTLLKNALEIDFGFATKEAFLDGMVAQFNRKSKVLYARDDFYMPLDDRKKEKDITEPLKKCVEQGWYYMKNILFALKRGQFFRAEREIEDLRQIIVDVLATERGLNSKHFRNVDQFEDNIKEELAKTYVKELSYPAIKISFFYLFKLFLSTLNERSRKREAKAYANLFLPLLKELDF